MSRCETCQGRGWTGSYSVHRTCTQCNGTGHLADNSNERNKKVYDPLKPPSRVTEISYELAEQLEKYEDESIVEIAAATINFAIATCISAEMSDADIREMVEISMENLRQTNLEMHGGLN